VKALCLILAGLLLTGPALALDSAPEPMQYGHTTWRIRDGFTNGPTGAFAQTPDGYLWLGTEFGLVRFDGVRAVPWTPPRGAVLPSEWIRALGTARDGTLWIGTLLGLATWDGRRLLVYPQFDGKAINALHEDREGTMWVGATASNDGLVCAIRGGATECQGGDGRFGPGVGSVYEQADGTLWIASGFDRVWRLKPEPAKAYPIPGTIGNLQVLGDVGSGAAIVGTLNGIQKIAEGRVEPYPLPGTVRTFGVSSLLRAKDGGLWIGTRDAGVLHVHGGRTEVFARADGLSGDHVHRLFEDREGNIWAATRDGIDRFRALAVTTQAEPGSGSVVAARDGSLWVGTGSKVKRWRGGRVDEVDVRGLPASPQASLFEDSRGRIWVGSQAGIGYIQEGTYTSIDGVPSGYVDSFAEGEDGSVWALHRQRGLLRISATGQADALWKDNPRLAQRLAADPVRGGLWIGTYSGGLSLLVDGRIVAAYSTRDGLGKGAVNQIRVAADGSVWAATQGGLSRITGGRIATLDSRSGLPCDVVHWTIEDADHAWWLYTACGLVRLTRSEVDAWTAAVDAGQAPRRVVATVLDSADGVRPFASISSQSPQVARSGDGRLWFVTRDGVTVLDPREIRSNPRPPPVHVEGIVADRKDYEVSSGVRLPALVRDVRIEYTATSLVAPEKIQFKYMLEGRDRDWTEAGNRRRAFYTDLDPGDYRFRVIASNNSGVWNEQGASLAFSVAPAYWQTWWFRALCAIALATLLWMFYRWRVRQIRREVSVTLDARVAERTRIARELHDTLLQSFNAVLLRLQTSVRLWPAEQGRGILEETIQQAAAAITEGRDAVQDLRGSAADLADALRSLGETLAVGTAPDATLLTVEVEGSARALHPVVRDDVVQVAGEALRNAFRHAHATRIEVQVRYDERELRVSVRDDGKGMEAAVSRAGREGHFGLRGMRERTQLIGAKLTFWSRPGSGTEVELRVPAARAYASAADDEPPEVVDDARPRGRAGSIG
jgi:signal transduction histidine kinase/ligand-binding sensor domain-containing protein